MDYEAIARTAAGLSIDGVILFASLVQKPLVLVLLLEMCALLFYLCIRPINGAVKMCSRVLQFFEEIMGYCVAGLGLSIAVTVGLMLREPMYNKVLISAVKSAGSILQTI